MFVIGSERYVADVFGLITIVPRGGMVSRSIDGSSFASFFVQVIT